MLDSQSTSVLNKDCIAFQINATIFQPDLVVLSFS